MVAMRLPATMTYTRGHVDRVDSVILIE